MSSCRDADRDTKQHRLLHRSPRSDPEGGLPENRVRSGWLRGEQHTSATSRQCDLPGNRSSGKFFAAKATHEQSRRAVGPATGCSVAQSFPRQNCSITGIRVATFFLRIDRLWDDYQGPLSPSLAKPVKALWLIGRPEIGELNGAVLVAGSRPNRLPVHRRKIGAGLDLTSGIGGADAG